MRRYINVIVDVPPLPNSSNRYRIKSIDSEITTCDFCKKTLKHDRDIWIDGKGNKKQELIKSEKYITVDKMRHGNMIYYNLDFCNIEHMNAYFFNLKLKEGGDTPK